MKESDADMPVLVHPTFLTPDPRLLVGNDSRDDAAAYDLGDGRSVISTTDFFMPIVDDPFEFGRIAATNAISDVYAMGGSPMMAIAIFGWPIDKLGPEVASKVVDGGRAACEEAGIPLAGGHSIDSPEPIFGLAVTGILVRMPPHGQAAVGLLNGFPVRVPPDFEQFVVVLLFHVPAGSGRLQAGSAGSTGRGAPPPAASWRARP